MESHDAFQYLFWAVFIVIAGSMLFRFAKFGGFRAAMFGASIQRTVGEVAAAGSSIAGATLRVHVLGSPPSKSVGLEFIAKSVASYHMVPISLSLSDAKKLIDLLQVAVGVASPAQPGT